MALGTGDQKPHLGTHSPRQGAHEEGEGARPQTRRGLHTETGKGCHAVVREARRVETPSGILLNRNLGTDDTKPSSPSLGKVPLVGCADRRR